MRIPIRPILLVLALLSLPATPLSAAFEICSGDCDNSGRVTVDEIVTMINIALGEEDASVCPAGDQSCDFELTVDEIVTGLGSALDGCPAPPRGELVVPGSQAVGVIRTTNGTTVGGTPHMPAQYGVREPPEVEVQDYVVGLQVPWSMAFAPDGRLFISERPGRIRVVVDDQLQPQPWLTLDVTAQGESGLMGIALDPDFPRQPFLYACYTGRDPMRNRIVRFEEIGGAGANPVVLVDDIPASSIHDGCRLKLGPDGMLYASTGDAAQRALSQELTSVAGKILRLNPNGTAPGDNPFPQAPLVWSYGHRNPQGLAFHPATGELFESEHGPSGEVSFGAYDEINRIEPGINYGWPVAVGAPLLPQYRDPLLTYPEPSGPVPPAGMSFYAGGLIPEWQGDLLVATLRSEHLHRVGFDSCGRVVAIERLFTNVFGRLRDVVEGPDGAIYVSTSNRDGRAAPGPDDDRILRIVPGP